MINTKFWDLTHNESYVKANGNIFLTINSLNKQFHSEVLTIEGDYLLFLRTKVIKHPLGNIKKLSGKNLCVKSFVVNSNAECHELKMSYSFFNEKDELIDTFCFEKKIKDEENVLKLEMNYKF
jgi:hypothetical protein